MKAVIHISRFLALILLSFIIFLPSFKAYFTHDDFFHLLIAKPAGLNNFLSFFDITQSYQGYPHFRPLTTQVFYSLAWIFDLNPLPMHILNFVIYIVVSILIYDLFKVIGFNEKAAFIGLFLYITSATHFGRIYFLSTQEFGYSLFVLFSLILFIKYIKTNHKFYNILCIFFYILALLSKEVAVVTPLLIFLTVTYVKFNKNNLHPKSMLLILWETFKKLFPYIIVTGIYLFFRIFYYGFAEGDSYIWDFSPRFLNTLFWYGVWSLNMPEMLVDFVGAGFSINPNLFRYWSKEITPIFILFGLQVVFIIMIAIKKLINKSIDKNNLIFGVLWFSVSLLPVLFLPLHKFSFYLTLATVGVAAVISSLMINVSKGCITVFCILWFTTSYMTIKLTEKTHWITRGAETANRVNNYFQDNIDKLKDFKRIVFIDSNKDIELPWKPSEILKTSLSNQNYFDVYYPGIFDVCYGNECIIGSAYTVEGRQFIGY